MENEAIEILGDISEKEYLAHRAIGGNMPRPNRVFEEMDVKYMDHKVPSNILKSIDDKVAKAGTIKNDTARAESKKRGLLARRRWSQRGTKLLKF